MRANYPHITPESQYLNETPAKIDAPEEAVGHWKATVAALPTFDPQKESVIVLLLNTKNDVIGWNLVSVGSLNQSICNPSEVFRPAIAARAYGIVLMHNHPSGDTTPSAADRQLTDRLNESAELLRIEFLDHVIVPSDGGDGHDYYSFREHGLLK